MNPVLLALLALVTLLSSGVARALELPEFTATNYAEHPLAGTIWTGTGEPATLAALAAAVDRADHIAVGETHDNPDHHAIQAAVIKAAAADGARPAIVLEMVPASYQDRLDAFLSQAAPDVAALGARLDWEKRGWPNWAMYRPIAEAALAGRLTLRAGGLDRETVHVIGRSGPEALEADERSRLGLDTPLAPEQAEALGELLHLAHCELLPAEAIGPMIPVQRARDGAMAAAMAQSATSVLIAGAGHARNDFGVPALLRARAPEADILSIALIELTSAEEREALDWPQPFDFVIFTPRANMTDHCAALKERFSKN